MPRNPVRARRVGVPGGRVAGNEPRGDSTSDSLALHCLTIALVLLAGIIFTLVGHKDAGHQHSNWCVFEIVVQSIVVLLGSVIARRFLMGPNALIIPPLLVVALLMSLICEPIQRSLFGTTLRYQAPTCRMTAFSLVPISNVATLRSMPSEPPCPGHSDFMQPAVFEAHQGSPGRYSLRHLQPAPCRRICRLMTHGRSTFSMHPTALPNSWLTVLPRFVRLTPV